jgi:GDP-4-dehydro-6-deoxy-D-mannose reductase
MSKIKILITGASGSAGSYLAEYLSSFSKELYEVIGTTRYESEQKDGYRLEFCDLTFLQHAERIIEYRPDYIFNLAANADVRGSFDNPHHVLGNNIFSTANLLEAIHKQKVKNGYDPIIQHCSTSEVYGIITEEECPVAETYPLKPVNVYAVSKLTQEQLALAYHKMYGLKVIVTRAFGYINPRRANIFSTAFARQIVDIERGKKLNMSHGNLDSVRTLLDVRDISTAYWYAATRGDFGEIYNIGSTQPISVAEFLTLLVRKSEAYTKSLCNPKIIRTYEDQALIRPIDVTLQIPDTRKFLAKTGWSPKYTLDESINWLLEECRNA